MAKTSKGARSALSTFWTNASYKSFGKPHFRESDGPSRDSEADEDSVLPLSSHPTRMSYYKPASVLQPDKRAPSSKLTLHQFLYIAGSHGIGAMLISGGINFAIAYGELSLSLSLFPLVVPRPFWASWHGLGRKDSEGTDEKRKGGCP